jgi:uncharacterized protein (TIGR03067 family)
MRQLFLVVAIVLCVSFSATADDEKELKRFQGDWRMVTATANGETVKGDKGKEKVWRFDGTKLIPLDDKDDVATITIDPTKKPATLDIKDKRGDVVEAIYKFTEDKLIICARSDNKRPKEFEAPKGSGVLLFEFERVKK